MGLLSRCVTLVYLLVTPSIVDISIMLLALLYNHDFACLSASIAKLDITAADLLLSTMK